MTTVQKPSLSPEDIRRHLDRFANVFFPWSQRVRGKLPVDMMVVDLSGQRIEPQHIELMEDEQHDNIMDRAHMSAHSKALFRQDMLTMLTGLNRFRDDTVRLLRQPIDKMEFFLCEPDEKMFAQPYVTAHDGNDALVFTRCVCDENSLRTFFWHVKNKVTM